MPMMFESEVARVFCTRTSNTISLLTAESIAHPLSQAPTGVPGSIMEKVAPVRMQNLHKALPKRPPQYRPDSDTTSAPETSKFATGSRMAGFSGAEISPR